MEATIVLMFIQGIVVGGFCSYVAGQKNRDQLSWFLLGCVFSFLALFALIAVPAKPIAPSSGSLLQPKPASESDIETRDRRACPFCAESIKVQAKVCKHCQRDIPLRTDLEQDKQINLANLGDINSLNIQSCLETLRDLGCTVSSTGLDKWKISTPKAGIVLYAYSIEELRNAVDREYKNRA